MRQPVITILELIRNLDEEAGSSPLTAALKIKERLKRERKLP
ncbi:MAG: hypothetical protein ACE5WD_10515 [Candidatus Aminicenantia bacterium]